MTKMKRAFFFITVFSGTNAFLVQNALAGPITFEWNRRVSVAVEFIPEQKLTGSTDNLYVYSVTNLRRPIVIVLPVKIALELEQPVEVVEPGPATPAGWITAFRVADPDHFGGFGGEDLPAGWSWRYENGFVWEVTQKEYGIAQGATVAFFLYSPGPYGVSTGQATFETGGEVFGPVLGPLEPVPEPSSLLLLGVGLLAAGRRLRSRRR